MNSQLAILDGKAITQKDIFSAIDSVVQDLYKTGDINKAANVLDALDNLGRLAAKAKAKLLYEMANWWSQNNPTENFYDFLESVTSENKATVVKRYINTQECIEEGYIPKELAERPMRDLIPVANAIKQGYEMDAKTLKRLTVAPSSEIGEIIRDVKGTKPRKSSMRIYLERDGSLYVVKGNKRLFVGYLNIQDEDELVLSAIARLEADRIIRK